MSTLLDRYDAFVDKYIGRSTKKQPKEDVAFQSDDYASINRKFSFDNLTPVKRRKFALSAPFYIKGIKKKGSDTFRAWFRFEKITNRGEPSIADKTIIRNFDIRANTKSKFKEADRCSHIYGDGFILISYLNDNTNGKDGAPDLSLRPADGAIPFDLRVLDPENLTEMKWKDNRSKSLGIQHFKYVTNRGDERLIHPDRVLHVPRNKLPFSKLGISDIDIIIDIISSYGDINIATGELLKWFAHGFVNVTKDNMKANERTEILKELKKHNNIYANDSKYKLEIITGEEIDPKEFYSWVVENIAAVLVMPTHILRGIRVGRVTGAEVGFSDYYRDVRDDQDLLYTPLVHKLYSQLLKSKGRAMIYEPIWNDIYIGELAEGEIDKLRAQTVEILMKSNVIDTSEARQKMNRGYIHLNPTKKVGSSNTEETTIEDDGDDDNAS